MTIVRDYTALISGTSWAGPDARKTPVVVTYSFENKARAYLGENGYSADAIKSFRAFDASERSAAESALRDWANAAGIKFVKVGAGQGDINFNKVNFDHTSSAGFAGYAYFPSRQTSDGYAYDGSLGGDVFLNTKTPQSGDYLKHVLLHEIGHALGLKHSFQGSVVLASDLDNTDHTVMSYTGYAPSLAHLDIDAVRALYGNKSVASGTLLSWKWSDASDVLTQKWGFSSSHIMGSGQKDVIYGGGGNDTIAGFAKADIIHGGDGKDTIYGGAGNDLLDGGAGNDTIYGGSYQYDSAGGFDTVDYRWSAKAVMIAASGGWSGDTQSTATGDSIGTDTLYGIANFYGGKGNDDISGSDVRNILRGGDGSDTLRGFDGKDELHGGRHYDTLYGDGGNDALFGESYSDILFGGAGKDRLVGGTGADQLTGDSEADTFVFANGYAKDRVLDFSNNVDTIELSHDLWSGTKTVAQVITAFAAEVGENVVFDFGDGDKLTLNNVHLAWLANDVLIA